MIEEKDTYDLLKQDFEKYYQQTLLPFLKSKENLRKKYLSRFWLLLLLACFFVPLSIIGIYVLNRFFDTNINEGLIFMLMAVFAYFIRGPYATYKKQIKNEAMEPFVRFFEGFKYQHSKGLNDEEITNSRIFPPYKMAYADDCFEGEHLGVKVRVMEEVLKNIRRTKRGQEEVTVFQGIAIELDMNKNFVGQTVVLKDSGFFNRFKGFDDLERVKLEDPAFEKVFEVYASNQTEARYILTPSFMENILDLKEIYEGKSVQLSFLDNKVLIAIETKQDMFEPYSFFKSNINKKKFDVVVDQFITIFSIIDILKLNRRLGL